MFGNLTGTLCVTTAIMLHTIYWGTGRGRSTICWGTWLRVYMMMLGNLIGTLCATTAIMPGTACWGAWLGTFISQTAEAQWQLWAHCTDAVNTLTMPSWLGRQHSLCTPDWSDRWHTYLIAGTSTVTTLSWWYGQHKYGQMAQAQAQQTEDMGTLLCRPVSDYICGQNVVDIASKSHVYCVCLACMILYSSHGFCRVRGRSAKVQDGQTRGRGRERV